MEQLRNDAKKLALLNVLLTTVFSILAIFSLVIFCGNTLNMHLKAHTVVMSVIGIPLFAILFYLWLQFLGDLKRAYEGNDAIKNAVCVGQIAIWLKIVASVIGFIAAAIVVNHIGVRNVSITSYEFGLINKGGSIELICKSLIAASAPFTAIMYVLLWTVSERKSEMRIITMALAVLAFFYITATIKTFEESSWFWGILELVTPVVEYLFLWKIYKGAEFK